MAEFKKPEAAPSEIRNPARQFGTYTGEAPWHVEVGFRDSLIRQKKWKWFCAFDESTVVGGAIVSTGYAGKTFVWVFDRESNTLLADSTKTLVSMQVSVADDASYREIARARGMWSIEREGVLWKMQGALDTIELDLVLDEKQMRPMTAICPTGEGRFNVTRKSVGASARGKVTVAGRTFTIDGRGLLDHSHGLMDRRTNWLWAIGADPAGTHGFNFIDGFNDGLESVVWSDGALVHIPGIRIEPKVDGWKVSTPDGGVELELDIEGVRSEDLNLGLVSSRYTQPIGVWRGRLLGRDIEYVGVAEQHAATW